MNTNNDLDSAPRTAPAPRSRRQRLWAMAGRPFRPGPVAIAAVAALTGSLAVGLAGAPASATTTTGTSATTTTTTTTCTGPCTLPADTVSVTITAQGAAGASGGSNGWASGGSGGLGTSVTANFAVSGSSTVRPGDTIQPVVLPGGSGGGGNELGQNGGNGGNGLLVQDTTTGTDLVVAGGGGGGGGAGGNQDQNGIGGLSAPAVLLNGCTGVPAVAGSGEWAGPATDSGGGGGGGAGCAGGSGAPNGASGSGGGEGQAGESVADSGASQATVAVDIGSTTTSYTLTYTEVSTSASITSAASTSFPDGQRSSFTVTATGSPNFTVNGTLPPFVSFVDNGNGTGTLTGAPPLGTDGVYPLTIVAKNSSGEVDQSFTLTVGQAPAISEPSGYSFAVGRDQSIGFGASGFPPPAITETGALPSGMSFVDNGDGTATLSGTPAAGTGGTYPLTIAATNSFGQATQPFTVTVDEPPAISAPSGFFFTVGRDEGLGFGASGFPTPVLNVEGTLPSGVTIVFNGNGTATLLGTPAAGTEGSYPLTIVASNQWGRTSQPVTLTVDPAPSAPAITSTPSTTFTVGQPGTFTVGTTGYPAPALAETGTLPKGVTFVDNHNGTATLAGTPAAGTGGVHKFTITATNSTGTATQTFKLTVLGAPAFTTKATATATVNSAFSTKIMTRGFPDPALNETGTLPTGVTFVDNHNGTATLAGTPAPGTAGAYTFTITATNSTGTATQTFTLTITS